MEKAPAASHTAAPTGSFDFTLNGERVTVDAEAPTTTLLDWLRRTGRTGTKCGCAEGDCGACSVAIVDRDAVGQATYRAINSCIALLPMFADREVVTAEGLARGTQLHPVQAAMVEHYGSQCGYCTPGFVVSLFEGYYRGALSDPRQANDQLCGNLCRCTGYRPIRDAAAVAATARTKSDPAADPFAARLAQPVSTPSSLAYTGDEQRFFRPTTLAELLELRHRWPEAALVAGATEIGVELNKKFKRFPTLISTEGVPELTRIERTASGWRIGAAATLTSVEEALGDEFPSLAQMIRVFASRQIRNRATFGGNLVTASPIGDSAPVLLTLDASVVLVSPSGERTVPLAEFFVAYRKTQLRSDEVMREVLLPKPTLTEGLTRRVHFEKVSHRRELDISIVAGAFCLEVDAKGVVWHARIAYGGVAAMPLRAVRAEAALRGQPLAFAIPQISALLREEFTPIDDVRGSSAYRRGLIVSLWEKFASGQVSSPWADQAVVRPSHSEVGSDASRALRHESAVGHVTGRAQYVDDIAQRRPMLEVWPVMAPHAYARIRRRNANGALALPGVVAVLMAEDVPGHNNVGVARADEPLFATDEVLFHSQLVALVVGESVAACRAAAALVEVDYEPLPAIVRLEDAIAQGSFHNEPRVMRRGDSASALAASAHRLSGEFAFGGQEHFYLETQAAWAECGDDGDVQICSSTQHPSEIQAIVCEVLHLPRHKVVVQAPRMGGGFGGKETQGNTPAALVALAALKTGRPVRLQWDRDLDMALTGKRHPFHARYEVGFDAEGRVRALEADLVSNGGWALDLSQPVLDRALFHLDNAYYLPAVKVTGRIAKTHVASNTAFRGFGGPQGMLVIEEVMDRIARTLGLPPEVVRERNFYHGKGETSTTHYGEDIGDNRLPKIWQRVQEQAQFAQRRTEIDAWNAAHPQTKRGLAITPVKFGISFTLTHYNQAGALVHLYQDGTVQVNHGGTEMGQGLHTKVLGVAMRELGLPAAAIRMMRTSTDKVPNTSATAASAGADLNGAAVRAACVTLRGRLVPIAAKLLLKAATEGLKPSTSVDIAPTCAERTLPKIGATDVQFVDGHVVCSHHPGIRIPFAQVVVQAYAERISLSTTGYYATPGISWDWTTMTGRPFAYYAFGAAVTEVEVDGYTGSSRVRRVDIVHDVGDSLNPGIDRGQIEGGFVQGMGWLTSEELKWDAKGRLLTHSASTYQIPAISDAPAEFNVTLLPDAANTNAIHGSKAVGEPPFMLALSVREAIRDAVAAFGPANGSVTLASPATGEAVFSAIQTRLASGSAASK